MAEKTKCERMARCKYYGTFVRRTGLVCGAEVPSGEHLPHFRERPDQEFDEYYCGCYGWD